LATLSGTTYSDTGLQASTSYSYRVRARDAVPNWSAFTVKDSSTTLSSSDTQAPTAPTSLSLTAGPNQISLTWNGSTDNVGVVEYRVERCAGSGCSTYLDIGAASGTTYLDTAVSVATNYSYRVRARDAAPNYSTYSNTASSMPADCD
jgi:chitodextrinase